MRARLAAFLFSLVVSFGAAAAQTAPLSLVITYHATPANRVALRTALEATEAARFARWKGEGVLASAELLVNRHVDSVTWDAMAILVFPDAAPSHRWTAIERASPGGLASSTLALVGAMESVPTELVRTGGTARGGPSLVIPYEVTVPVPDYLAYLDGYVVPQMDGWMEEGVLARYAVLLPRYPAGRPWQSLLVLEYRDDDALDRRDATTAKVRTRLKDNPNWKAISDAKKNVRNEKAPAVADAIPIR